MADPAKVAADAREWLRRFPREPADRLAVAHAAVDAFERCVAGGTDLGPLVTAASSRYKLVHGTGAALLVRLAADRSDAQAALVDMARTGDATARFHAVAYLEPTLPEPVRREIVCLALGDRVAKVRAMAVDRTEGFGFAGLLPRLEDMAQTERNPAVLRALAFSIPLLRDGYFVKPDGDGHWLTVRTSRGVSGCFIPAKEFSDEVLQQRIADLRARSLW